MKKIIPIITIAGMCLFLPACSNNLTAVHATDSLNENHIEKSDKEIVNAKENNLSKTVLNKYQLEIDTPSTLELTEKDYNSEIDQPNIIEGGENANDASENEIISDTNKIDSESINNADLKNISEINEESGKISTPEIGKDTLYSLSNDVENECDTFCELKNQLLNAILETENLIQETNNQDYSLSREDRLLLNDKAMQLQNLANQLINATTELSYNLSDLKRILDENNINNNLPFKYLLTLNNLMNNNAILQSGLNTLYSMNNMLKNNANISIGYQQNNEPPVVKNYSVNENGEIIETENNTNTNSNYIDSYNNNNLKSNIDSYSSNIPNNIDTFFNTALLDNQLMYGNNYRNGFGFGFNPYMNQYANYEQNHKHNVEQQQINDNKDNINTDVDDENEKVGNKERKFKLEKNIDTYKDLNKPSLKSRIKNFKENISNSLNKIKMNKIK